MKPLLLVFMLGFSVLCYSQNNFTFPDNQFLQKDGFRNKSIDSIKIVLPFFEKSALGFNSFLFKGNDLKFRSLNNYFEKSFKVDAFRSKMPVYKPEFCENMPVMLPDSTIKYKILIKKFNTSDNSNNVLP
ncbi:MAG: hypothetical protein U0W24_23190 [Bacteroidales bacterium]